MRVVSGSREQQLTVFRVVMYLPLYKEHSLPGTSSEYYAIYNKLNVN